MNIIQRPGPAAKTGYGVSRIHAKDGIVEHSAEGYEAGMLMVLDGSQYIQSWHASIMKDGRLLQHYPWNTICYHAGNRPMNERKIGVEHEGIAGEPLTEAQIVTSVSLARELSRTFGFPMARGVGLHEHNEVVTLYSPNAGPTACPSGRIPWERYTELEDDMTDEWAYFTDDADPQYDANGVRVTGGVYRREFEYWQRAILAPQLQRIEDKIDALTERLDNASDA